MGKIKMDIDVGYVGCDFEDELEAPDDWLEMSEKERQDYLEDVAQEHLCNNISASAWFEED